MSSPGEAADESPDVLAGILHIHLAFDWGDEIDLPRARTLIPSEHLELARRRRTPISFSFRPPPVYIGLPPVSLELAELGKVEASAGLTLFDFGAISLALRVPFKLPPERLQKLAASLSDPSAILQKARSVLKPMHERLLPVISQASWDENLSEEFFVFQLPPGEPLPEPELLTDPNRGGPAGWLASLIRLEDTALSTDEMSEALRLHLSYSGEDLFVADWAAAVLIDRDCDETLQAIEFANLQLLEFRNIDDRLDQSLTGAYRTLHPLTRGWLPFWRLYARPLRVLGELKLEANTLFERTSNALKLVGDPYLARVYRLVARRFHLDEWEADIQRKLDVIEGAYKVVSDQADTLRSEFLEIIIILLITFEIVWSLLKL